GDQVEEIPFHRQRFCITNPGQLARRPPAPPLPAALWLRARAARSRTPQQINFLGRQSAELAWLDVERQRAITHTLDLLHVMADLFKHAANLAVLALDQRQLVPGILSFANQPDLRRRGSHGLHVARSRPAADPQAPAKLLNIFFGRLAADFYQ